VKSSADNLLVYKLAKKIGKDYEWAMLASKAKHHINFKRKSPRHISEIFDIIETTDGNVVIVQYIPKSKYNQGTRVYTTSSTFAEIIVELQFSRKAVGMCGLSFPSGLGTIRNPRKTLEELVRLTGSTEEV